MKTLLANIIFASICLVGPALNYSVGHPQNSANQTLVRGKVQERIGDFRPPSTGAVIPSGNRSVYVFRGIYRKLDQNCALYKVVKTNRRGEFAIAVRPGVYTVAIIVGSKLVPSHFRADGYASFVDVLKERNTVNVTLYDDSRAILGR